MTSKITAELLKHNHIIIFCLYKCILNEHRDGHPQRDMHFFMYFMIMFSKTQL